MNKFDEVTDQLGWIKPYEEVPLWYRKANIEGKYICRFSVNDIYELHDRFPEIEKNVTKWWIESHMNAMVGTFFREKEKEWILPLLASDYFYNRHENTSREQELKYARMSMRAVGSKVTPLSFSPYLRELLTEK